MLSSYSVLRLSMLMRLFIFFIYIVEMMFCCSSLPNFMFSGGKLIA